jgi:hypothetical protein
MSAKFDVPDGLMLVMKDIYRTLLEDCEKNVYIDISTDKPAASWFRVEGEPEKDGTIKVTGNLIGFHRYALWVSPDRARFETDDDGPEAEHTFYIVIQAIAAYRVERKLPPMDTRILDGLAVADSPPVNAENYAEIPPEDRCAKLGLLISECFRNMSFKGQRGGFCYYLCTAQGNSHLSLNYIGVFIQLLNSFSTAFPSKIPAATASAALSLGPMRTVQLFAVRWSTVQRLYFVNEEGRLYYCKTDESRKFLEENLDYIYETLMDSPFRRCPPSPSFGKNYRFSVEEEITDMR